MVARMKPVVCMSGCARNEVRTLSSSWLSSEATAAHTIRAVKPARTNEAGDSRCHHAGRLPAWT
jgi:hypothetical protein